MSKRLHVCAVHDLPPGARHVVDIGHDEEVLVLNVDGTIYAISNICPHEGAALERGIITDGVLYCPLHRWGFVLASGASVDEVALCAPTYRVERRHGQLLLCLP